MASVESPKLPRMRQARKSIAYIPSTDTVGDKENATVDTSALTSLESVSKSKAKKTRSKSIGPGGLAALKEDSGNIQPAFPPFVKSILKPTVALSPPKTIPPHNGGRKASPGRPRGPKTPEKSPRKSPVKSEEKGSRASGKSSHASLKSPSGKSRSTADSPARVAVRTEEEQQAAVRERERQAVLAYKDARRKSLANRRVSFAPEATLHTWDVVEMPEDSTTSSASTNFTRRASGLTANTGSPCRAPRLPRSPMPSSEGSEPPSTPPEQAEELQLAASPAHQRDLHQKKRRRSSGIPPMNFNNLEDFSSSPHSGGDEDTNQSFVTAEEIDKDSDSSSNVDDLVEDETVTGVDGEDNTIQSTGSNSTVSGRLEAALQQAAKQAGTQGIDYDEHGDITMEMADDEITNAFKPWLKQGKYVPQVVGDPSTLQNQENLNPFSPAFKANVGRESDIEGNEGDAGTMEMTQAIGGILPAAEISQGSPKRRKRKTITGNNRKKSIAERRRSSGESFAGDETMDLTMAVGGIHQDQEAANVEQHNEYESDGDDEELTMEFTSLVGGMVQSQGSIDDQLASQQLLQDADHRDSANFSENDETMDITYAAGGILPSIVERTEPLEDQTQDMDTTRAVGAILPPQLDAGNKAEAKILMEQETNVGQLTASPFGTPRQKPVGVGLMDERPLPGHVRTVASETGSPGLARSQVQKDIRKSFDARASAAPKSKQSTPIKKPSTPSKQLAPQPVRPLTPGKTPPSKNVSRETASPKKLAKVEIKPISIQPPNSSPRTKHQNLLFHEDSTTGATTPNVVLKPRQRRSSGLGVDREGLGSPAVTALLDKRGSIGERAITVIAQSQATSGVRFEDPQVMERQLDQERAEDHRRESDRDILEHEADAQDLEEKDATANLKDMIESLTPQKKRKLNGRKSLHIGAARGLLGKRPAELDDGDVEDHSLKSLKGQEGSPVKKVKLPAPQPMTTTVGRNTRSSRLSLVEGSGNARINTPVDHGSPLKLSTAPRDQSRFKDVESKRPPTVPSFEGKLDGDVKGALGLSEEEDRIHLQDFLNMTSIRFMELTTTKRRHTIAPNPLTAPGAEGASNGDKADGEVDASEALERRVVAGACTLPMLDLYQHSCRILKDYISEGRSVVKEIEADTYEDNPPLFREFLSAPPDVKSFMDNQFKNVKMNARLLTKAMWYEWRMKLLDGLKEGLLNTGAGMGRDDRSLTQQEHIIHPVLPGLIERHEQLEVQVQLAQEQADELARCDQDELKEARENLLTVEQDLQSKRRLMEDLEDQLRNKEHSLGSIIEKKQECVEDIKEAEKIRQECRGWSIAEVAKLQSNVVALEDTYGWCVVSTMDSTVTMTYKRTIQLFFTPSSFRRSDENERSAQVGNAPISLTYTADAHVCHPQPLTTEKRFFLQIMRAQLQCLQQSQTSVKDLLTFVSSNWETASKIAEEARMLSVGYITEPTIISDEAMAIRSVILLHAMRTKVEVILEVRVRSGEGVATLGVGLKSAAKVCYGEGLKEKKMAEFLESKIKGIKEKGTWVRAVGELEDRLRARGKKT